MLKKITIEIKERMYLLKNINEENDFKICKLKSWGSYRMISLREIKNSNCRFNPNSQYKHMLSNKWDIVFRGELDIGYIDIKKIIDKFIENSDESVSKMEQTPEDKINSMGYRGDVMGKIVIN